MQTYIIDGSGFLFRAYYGLPELMDSEGRNVNVLYGFCSMMIGLLMDKPDHFVIARDAGMDTVRRENFAEYKANRPSAPDDLKRQIGATQEFAAAMGIPAYIVPGYEADDIIYTIALDRAAQGDDVTIVSSDKDLKQLLSPRICTLDTMKKIRTTEHSFREEMGFEPEHFLDYLSLIGDASDNIPGVAGIGPKTADKLIKQYKTLENIYDHLDEIGGKVVDKLRASHTNAVMSKRLITLLEAP
jgi:DNA polymerase I